MKKYLFDRIRSFIKNKKGAITIEAVMVFVTLSAPVIFFCIQVLQLSLANIYTQGNAFFAVRNYSVGAGNSTISETANKRRTEVLASLNLLPMLPAKIMFPFAQVKVEKTDDSYYIKMTTYSMIHFDPFGTFSKGSSAIDDNRLFTVGTKVGDLVKQLLGSGANMVGDLVAGLCDMVITELGTTLLKGIFAAVDNIIDSAKYDGIPAGKMLNKAVQLIGKGSLGKLIGNAISQPLGGSILDSIRPMARDYIKGTVVSMLGPVIENIGNTVTSEVDRIMTPLLGQIGIPNRFMEMYGYACMLPPRKQISYGQY